MTNSNGEKITINNGVLSVPDFPTIPFIEGDGIGPDIWNSAVHVFDSAVKSAYGDKRKIIWKEIYAGEKANHVFKKDIWLPKETLDIIEEYKVAIKCPLTTPVGGGIRSINVALRQKLDLYVCLRPIRYFNGVPSPLKNPENTNMVIFRENTEDIYAGIEFAHDSSDANDIKNVLKNLKVFDKVRFPETTSFGIKPISEEGTKRLVSAAIQYAINNNRSSVTLVHKGNIMKYTEGYFRKWGYEVAKEKFMAKELDGGPWLSFRNPENNNEIIIKDVIADAFLQQILTRPKEYDVVATMNLNGDYISDALAAQVGGIGIAPGANLNYQTGIAIFEATHGTAPKYAGLDKVNPSSVILSGEMMLRYMGWKEAADNIIVSMEKVLQGKRLTYDFARLIPNSEEISCSEFGKEIASLF